MDPLDKPMLFRERKIGKIGCLAAIWAEIGIFGLSLQSAYDAPHGAAQASNGAFVDFFGSYFVILCLFVCPKCVTFPPVDLPVLAASTSELKVFDYPKMAPSSVMSLGGGN